MSANRIVVLSLAVIASTVSFGQGCCSGGGGTPMAGGAATGVLQEGQIQVISSYKYTWSDKFLAGDKDTIPFFENLSSNYSFVKVDYGISNRLTLSVASGYYFNRSIREFADTTYNGSEMEIEHGEVGTKGFGDLILFPRYNVYEKTSGVNKTELSLGIGWKIPLGSHNDSTFIGHSNFINFDNNPPTLDSVEIWQIAPPTTQTTTGSHDLMFYGFYYKSFPNNKISMFATGLYVMKGWNSLGIKFGDYASLGLSAGTSVFKRLGILGQIKGEWIGKMRSHDKINVLAEYSIDEESTGTFGVSFVPQIMYSFKKPEIALFVTGDIPLYQRVNGLQIANKYQMTGGISLRFMAKKKADSCVVNLPLADLDPNLYKEAEFKVWGNCEMCETKIESTIGEMKGIAKADWDLETLTLKLVYKEVDISLDEVKKKLAKIGYDTETHRASDKAYNNLHSCCKYERPE